MRCLTVLAILSGGLLSGTTSLADDVVRDWRKNEFADRTFAWRLLHPYKMDPYLAKVSAGVGTSLPLGWERPSPTVDLRFRNRMVDLSWSTFQTAGKPASELMLGLQTPVGPGIGRRPVGLWGAYVRPVAAFGFAANTGGLGAYAGPGVQLSLPIAVIEARVPILYTAGTPDSDLPSGLAVRPQISIQLDALFDLFDPDLQKVGVLTTSSTSTTPIGGGWAIQRTSTTKQDISIRDVGGWWGVTPRAGLNSGVPGVPNVGIGVSGRRSVFGIDGFVMLGAYRPGSAYNRLKLNESDELQGSIVGAEVSVDLSADLALLVLGVVAPNSVEGVSWNTTPYTRLSFSLGPTIIIPGKATFKDEAAAMAAIDEAFAANPDLERNAANDPSRTAVSWGPRGTVGYELGPLAVRGVFSGTPKVGSKVGVEVAYTIPLSKIRATREQGVDD